MVRLFRRYLSILVGVCLMAVMYQNCGRGFSVGTNDSSSNDSLGTTTPGATDPGFFAFPFSYSGLQASFPVGESMSLKPQYTSADVFAYSYTIAPALPSGVSLNASTGEISGATSASSGDKTYVVTAKNNKGVATATFNLNFVETLPQISFPSETAIFYTNVNSISIRPLLSGARSATFSISPILPVGLGINATTGEISGKPVQAAAEQIYTVSAESPQGKAQFNLKVAIVDPPSALYYAFPKNIYRVGKEITKNFVIFPASAGYIRNAEISPRPPAGLYFSSLDGSLTGTPVEVVNETNFSVKLEDRDGNFTNVVLNMSVLNNPPKLSLPGAANVQAAMGSNFNYIIKNSGGRTSTYAITPAQLPEGLFFSTTNGSIYGTPKAQADFVAYTVTATNEMGTSSVKFNLKIGPKAPNPKYPFVKYLVNLGSAMDAVVPYIDSDSGEVNWYSSDVALPDGLTLDNRTGRISGTPTVEAINKKIRIVASGSGGFKIFNVSFTVRANLPALSSLSLTSCTSSYSSGCIYNSGGFAYVATNFIDGTTVDPLQVTGLDGEIVDYYSANGRYLLSSEGSLFIIDSAFKTYSLISGYSKNVKSARVCDFGYLCILLKNGSAQILSVSYQGTNPPVVSQVTTYADLPQNALEMSTGNSNGVCYILPGGGIRCKTGISSSTSTTAPAAYDVASAVGAEKFAYVLGSLCYLATDKSLNCFNLSVPNANSTVQKVAGLPALNKVLSYYGYACALTATNGVKCWGRDRIASANDPLPTPCSGTTCLPAVTAPVDIAGLTSGVVDIALTDLKICGLLDTGVVRCASFDPTVTSDKRYLAAASDVQGMNFGMKSLKGNVACLFAQTAVGGLKTKCGPGDVLSGDSLLGIYIAR